MTLPLEKTFLPQKYIGLAVEKPSIPDAIRMAAKEAGFFEKTNTETHVSVMVTKNVQALWKVIAMKENTDEVLKSFKELFESYTWEYFLTDEYFLHEKVYLRDELDVRGEFEIPEHLRRTIVQKVTLPALADFYEKVNSTFGAALPLPIPHVSLFTWADYEPLVRKGIGINSAEEFEKCTKKVLNPCRELKGNYAFIDGQNLHVNTARRDTDAWRVDMTRFRVYLARKYRVTSAYYFIGHKHPEHNGLYDSLRKAGFELVFREHNSVMVGKKKGNVDPDIIFSVMKKMYKREDFDKVVLVSGDGDYKQMVDFLVEEGRFEKILFPDHEHSSSLYKQISSSYYDYLDKAATRRKIERVGGRFNEKAPYKTAPFREREP